ncbi:tripartite tricarboxylate transporter permease [Ancylobacter sp. Lp-2]|uniref:tripartite tricarboxylate transporter permease n=1 Tax=Ancylobacter sp. Lp-2 TaxID=2881339 RepID=UPI001E64239C|nr:tripartite tricarboxylate transporter permease [Ancylobacter sp. Lp-2]MCB4768632.1 tripartite tricarboxylate transporter permease [Ancylobacter sp. Lp-2]
MDALHSLALGFQVASSPLNLFYCLIGVSLGTLIGILPGVGPLLTIAMLIPLTFGMPPESSVIMLAGIYYGASYGGSTAAILVNLPGEPSSVVTCIDGHQMARQGRGGVALAIAAIGSFVAGSIGTALIVLCAPILQQWVINFSPADYASLIFMALIATATLVQGSVLNGIGMALLGVLIGLVGMDPMTGASRFTFGSLDLMEGIDFVVVAIGVFAVAEIVQTLDEKESRPGEVAATGSIWPSLADLKASCLPILRGTGIGALFGVLPGTGPTISSIAAYFFERRIARDPSRFGHGAIEGVAAAESANNAAAQTGFIPTMTMGIPGSATMAMLLGALMMNGVNPGPNMIAQRPELFWGLIASMWIGNLMLLILNLPLIGMWVKILRVPYRWLFPAILVFSALGLYSLNLRAFDLYLMLGFGVGGYLLARLRCEPVPFIIGIILGPMLEEHFRRAMVISQGDPSVFVTSWLSLLFLVLSVLIVLLMTPRKRLRAEAAAA